MPRFLMFTNVAASKVSRDFYLKTTEVLASVLSKPKERIMVHVVPDQTIFMGGTDEPFAYATLHCIGGIGKEQNKKYASSITKHVSESLGIKSERFSILFVDIKKEDVAYNGITMDEILK